MPQLDKVTFYLQYTSMIWAFLFFHYVIKQTLVKTIFITLKIRELFALSFLYIQRLSIFLSRYTKTELWDSNLTYLESYFFIVTYFKYIFFNNLKKDLFFIENKFFSPVFAYVQVKSNLFNKIISGLNKS